MKLLYPFIIFFNKLSKSRLLIQTNSRRILPNQPFYDLRFSDIDGREIDCNTFRGKKILVVNTASDCGYTSQYSGLERLYEQYSGRLVVIGFPSNDFGGQEPGSNATVLEFCRQAYSIQFPMAEKSVVKKGPGQHAVFAWLTDSKKNGWSDRQASWNFSKWLLDEEAVLINYFDPAIEPGSAVIDNAINS